MRALLFAVFFVGPAFAADLNVGERIRHTAKAQDCENIQTMEVDLREQAIAGDSRYFHRAHNHIAFCDVRVRLPEYGHVRLVGDRSKTKIHSIEGDRVRITLASKCVALEKLSFANPNKPDPAYESTVKRIREDCVSKAKKILERLREIHLDFDIQAAE